MTTWRQCRLSMLAVQSSKLSSVVRSHRHRFVNIARAVHFPFFSSVSQKCSRYYMLLRPIDRPILFKTIDKISIWNQINLYICRPFMIFGLNTSKRTDRKIKKKRKVKKRKDLIQNKMFHWKKNPTFTLE